MTSRARSLTCLLALLLVVTALPSPAAAHVGPGCGISTPAAGFARLQAECFTGGDAGCDPDADGEHTQIYTGSLPPGVDGSLVMAPHSGCAIRFSSLSIPPGYELYGFRVFRNNAALTIRVDFFLDGVLQAQGTYTGVSGGGYGNFLVGTPVGLPPGVHSLRVAYTVIAGATYQNFFLDAVDFRLTCPNSPPVPAFGVNAMPGNFLWRGLPYSFTGSAVDPDGDPVTYSWTFGDGGSANNAAAQHTFNVGGARVVTLTATDNPNARCPGALPLSGSVQRTVHMIDDEMAILVHPSTDATRSCVFDRDVNTFVSTLRTIAGTCRLDATFLRAGAPVAQAGFQVDAQTFAADASSPYTVQYDSLDFTLGRHTLRVCFWMNGDVHEHAACSPGIEYLNVGMV